VERNCAFILEIKLGPPIWGVGHGESEEWIILAGIVSLAGVISSDPHSDPFLKVDPMFVSRLFLKVDLDDEIRVFLRRNKRRYRQAIYLYHDAAEAVWIWIHLVICKTMTFIIRPVMKMLSNKGRSGVVSEAPKLMMFLGLTCPVFQFMHFRRTKWSMCLAWLPYCLYFSNDNDHIKLYIPAAKWSNNLFLSLRATVDSVNGFASRYNR
jgi:hypothetical protein